VENALGDWILSGAMFALMFGMGLTLTLADFRRVAADPTATIVGTVLQLIVMPIVGFGLARLFELPPLLTAGMVVFAACPGGMFSNMYVHIARGHTALSITLTAIATLVTLFTLPLWVRVVSASSSDTGQAIEMPVLDTALQLGSLTVLPVLLGMATRNARPSSLSWEKSLSRVSAGIIVVTAFLQAGGQPELPIEAFERSFMPVAWFSISAVALGIGASALLRLGSRDAVTIGVELVVKNTLLGIVLVNNALDFEALVPVFVFAVVQGPTGILLLVTWRMLVAAGYLAPLVSEESPEPPAANHEPTPPPRS
jgi:BASS family bile acid:Na+ symporter